ncbi:MAG: superoxide dismutase [Candidatus Omnitrophica bacterium]|nr:superoxide dismutase [Candidatus Omnitrophota bacterium]
MGESIVYQAKDFSYLKGTAGFSDTLLENHFKLYQGYVKNTNIILEQLNLLKKEGKDRAVDFAELKRRFGWEFNGMRLHELYFENIGANNPLDPKSELAKKIIEDFTSLEQWKKDFVSTALMRGIGWVLLYQDSQSKQLFNVWVNEHDVGHLVTAKVILVLDVFEHAYLIDYQLERAKYVENFLNVINWKIVQARF